MLRRAALGATTKAQLPCAWQAATATCCTVLKKRESGTFQTALANCSGNSSAATSRASSEILFSEARMASGEDATLLETAGDSKLLPVGISGADPALRDCNVDGRDASEAVE